MADSADGGGELHRALTRLWERRGAAGSSNGVDERLEEPALVSAPRDGRETALQVSHVALRQWMLKVQQAVAGSDDWLVVAIAVAPCSLEETALVLLVAEQPDWVYVPIDSALPLSRQLQMMRTARVDRVVSLPGSPLARFLANLGGEDALRVDLSVPRVWFPLQTVDGLPDELFQPVQVFALSRDVGSSLKTAVQRRLGHNCAAPLYVLHTSGSTGEPKGVLGTRDGAWSRMEWMWSKYPFRRGECVARTVKLTFVDSVWEVFGAFVQGIPLVHFASSTIAESAGNVLLDERAQFLHNCKTCNVTRFTAVPSVLNVLVSQRSKVELHAAFEALRYMLVSGESFPLSLVLRLTDMLPHVTVLNLYGSTEVAGDVTCMSISHPVSSVDKSVWREHGVPIGVWEDVIGLDTTIMLVDEFPTNAIVLPRQAVSTEQSVIADRKGELCVAGCAIALGYITADDVMPLAYCSNDHLSNSSKKWFKTGDICATIGGRIYLCGRRDRMVKVRGLRVQLDAVERAVAEALIALDDDLRSSQVTAIDVDDPIGDGLHRKMLLVFLVRASDGGEQYEELSVNRFDGKLEVLKWVSEKFGATFVPNDVLVLSRAGVTQLPNGKVDWRAFGSIYKDYRTHTLKTQRFESVDSDPASVVKTELSKVVRLIDLEWDKVLSSTIEQLGGDSLLAALFHFELRQLYDFTETPTELARMTVQQIIEMLKQLRPMVLERSLPDIQSVRASKRSRTSVRSQEEEILSESISGGLHCISRSSCMSCGASAIPACRPLCSVSRLPAGSSTSLTMEMSWKADLEKCIDASPLLVVQPGSAQSARTIWAIAGSHAGIVVCVDVDREGSVVWRTKVDDRVEASASLSVRNELVYVGTYSGSLYALDLKSGKVKWTFQCDGTIKAAAVPIDECEVVILGAYDHKLRAIKQDTGVLVWEYAMGSSIFSCPFYINDRAQLLCGTTRGDLSLLQMSSLTAVRSTWERAFPAPIFSSLVADSTTDLAIVGCADGCVYGVSLLVGDIRWTVATDKPVFSSPCLFSDRFVVIGSHDGKLRKIDTTSGCVSWSSALDGPIFASPTVVQLGPGRLLCCVATTTGSLYTINEYDGSVVCRADQGPNSEPLGELFSSPVVLDHVCVIGTRRNWLLCFDLSQ